MLRSYKWMDWVGLGWDGLDLCVGLLYGHRFAVLITAYPLQFVGKKQFLKFRLFVTFNYFVFFFFKI